MFIHDLIKIKYIGEGYLQDHPYKMISDSAMFEAFTADDGYFDATYPCPDPALEDKYNEFKGLLFEKIHIHLETGLELDDWVYSYMLGSAIGPMSADTEICYLNDLLNVSVSDVSEYSKITAEAVYEVSEQWLKKMAHKYKNRVPTLFGEPYIIKSLRLADVDVLGG